MLSSGITFLVCGAVFILVAFFYCCERKELSELRNYVNDAKVYFESHPRAWSDFQSWRIDRLRDVQKEKE